MNSLDSPPAKEEEFWVTEKDALGLNIVVNGEEEEDTAVKGHDVALRRKNEEKEAFKLNDKEKEDAYVPKEINTSGGKEHRRAQSVTVKEEVETLRMKDEEDITLKEEEAIYIKEERETLRTEGMEVFTVEELEAVGFKTEEEAHVRMKEEEEPHGVKEEEQQISIKLKNEDVFGVTEKKRELCEEKPEHDFIKTRRRPDTEQRTGTSRPDERFTHSKVLNIQERIQTEEKTQQYSQLGPFEYLTEHKRTHTGEKSYKCFQCGKSFTQAGTLKEHERIHTGEKPYHCSQCGKNFIQSPTLKTHQLTHTGKKSFHCPHCGKSFGHSSTLKTHQLTHTGEKPHHCSQYGKSFTQLATLKQHQRTHTGENIQDLP